jgi:hypothetical protein
MYKTKRNTSSLASRQATGVAHIAPLVTSIIAEKRNVELLERDKMQPERTLGCKILSAQTTCTLTSCNI